MSLGVVQFWSAPLETVEDPKRTASRTFMSSPPSPDDLPLTPNLFPHPTYSSFYQAWRGTVLRCQVPSKPTPCTRTNLLPVELVLGIHAQANALRVTRIFVTISKFTKGLCNLSRPLTSPSDRLPGAESLNPSPSPSDPPDVIPVAQVTIQGGPRIRY